MEPEYSRLFRSRISRRREQWRRVERKIASRKDEEKESSQSGLQSAGQEKEGGVNPPSPLLSSPHCMEGHGETSPLGTIDQGDSCGWPD